MNNPSFSRFDFAGQLYADGDISVIGLRGYTELLMREGAYFVYVHSGICQARGDMVLTAGMYACVNWGNLVVLENSQVLVVQHRRFQSMHQFGGPIEERGRLTYIDGCSDSLLIAPVRKGDPCLNHLHFPLDINQTQHTHPNIRVGIVARGWGECITPFGNAELREGDIFIIHPENGKTALGADGKQHAVGTHSFRTRYRTMDVVAFHPSSSVGPTDEYHQMLVETMIAGKSAAAVTA